MLSFARWYLDVSVDSTRGSLPAVILINTFQMKPQMWTRFFPLKQLNSAYFCCFFPFCSPLLWWPPATHQSLCKWLERRFPSLHASYTSGCGAETLNFHVSLVTICWGNLWTGNGISGAHKKKLAYIPASFMWFLFGNNTIWTDCLLSFLSYKFLSRFFVFLCLCFSFFISPKHMVCTSGRC